MKIYTLKIVLRGISPMIWRRIRVPGATSLADLHYVIQTIYGWDDEHLHQFHIYGKDYGINYDGGLGYSDNAHKVYLDDFAFDADETKAEEGSYKKIPPACKRTEDGGGPKKGSPCHIEPTY